MIDMRRVGKKILALRKEHNMTQMELADRLGVTFQAVSNWERGSSMPDIGNLPALAECFEVSLDELLGKKSALVEAAINDNITECMEQGDLSEKEVSDALPILKPSQVDTVIQNVDKLNFSNVNIFLPYLGEDDVKEFAEKALEQGESIGAYLPFLSEEDVKEYAGKVLERGESISPYLPFLSEEDVKEYAGKVLERGESIGAYLPFLSEEDVGQFAGKALERGESINSYLPFLSGDDVKELALRSLGGDK